MDKARASIYKGGMYLLFKEVCRAGHLDSISAFATDSLCDAKQVIYSLCCKYCFTCWVNWGIWTLRATFEKLVSSFGWLRFWVCNLNHLFAFKVIGWLLLLWSQFDTKRLNASIRKITDTSQGVLWVYVTSGQILILDVNKCITLLHKWLPWSKIVFLKNIDICLNDCVRYVLIGSSSHEDLLKWANTLSLRGGLIQCISHLT